MASRTKSIIIRFEHQIAGEPVRIVAARAIFLLYRIMRELIGSEYFFDIFMAVVALKLLGVDCRI
jgi:hypothetical protein